MRLARNLIFWILDLFFYFKRIQNSISKKKIYSNIRVLIYHDFKSDYEIKQFKNQILSLKKEYEFISPDEFEEYLNNKPIKGEKILITFDDGFKSNRIVAEKVLNKLNIKALFFIISDFIGAKKNSSRYNSIMRNIYPNRIEKFKGDDAMNKNDIDFLLSTGHKIGCHTLSHQMLSKVSSIENLNDELIASKRNLQKEFGIEIKHFAFPFGTFESVNKEALKILDKNFDFIHSGLRGNNVANKKLINREAIDPLMSVSRIKSYLKGNIDFLYVKKFKKLNQFLS